MTDVDSTIARLRGRFLDRLAGQYETAVRQTQDAQRLGDNSDNLREVLLIAHKVAGIAKSVGFPELGLAAFNTDQVLRRWLAGEAPNQTEEEIFSILREFLASCEKVLSKN
jgi:HPt (histidine-containing phosphotransfer) domain-containing protein